MANEDSQPNPTNAEGAAPARGFRRSRKFAISLNTLALILLAAAITVMVNFISIRHNHRFDLTATNYYSLSDATTQLLKTLKDPIRCVVFFQPSQAIYEDVRNLLREYQYKSKLVEVELVDPDRNFARTEELVKEYDITEANGVIFVRGQGANKKSKYVTSADIVEMDNSGMMYGQPSRVKGFKGEQAFTSAIQSVLEAKQPTIYFLTGHGERDPESYDERSGYSTLATDMKRENLKIAKLNLGTTSQIPSDCDVLVVAGPSMPVPRNEQEIIQQYLQSKGRMLVLLDAQKDAGLQELLNKWGVTVDNDMVVGVVSVMGLTQRLSATAVGTEYGSSPIVKKLQGKNTMLPLARSLEVENQSRQPTPDKPRVTWLVKSHKTFWGETSLGDLENVKFDEGADKKGPVILAVAVESGNLPGTPVDIESTRMVVVGSSGFVANGAMSEANFDLFLNSINWLINKPERVLGISPKTPRQFKLFLTDMQERTLKLSLVFGMPGCVAIIGAVVWWLRRK